MENKKSFGFSENRLSEQKNELARVDSLKPSDDEIYNNLVEELKIAKGEEKQELIRRKKLLDEKKKSVKEEQEQKTDYSQKVNDLFKREEIISVIPDDLANKVTECFSKIPKEFQEDFAKNLEGSLLGKEQNDVKKITGIKGVLFEMSRIVKILEQGRETLGKKVGKKEKPLAVIFKAYPEFVETFQANEEYVNDLADEHLKTKIREYYNYDDAMKCWSIKDIAKAKKIKGIFKESDMSYFVTQKYFGPDVSTLLKKTDIASEIQVDVPIVRIDDHGNEEIYIYETKSYSRRILGGIPSNYNQLLKYNSAVEQKKVKGATMELEGRIDPEFLKWAAGSTILETGNIPNVEIIYNLPLSENKEFRFVLKRAKNGNGLNFINDEQKYSEEEKKIIAGLRESVIDKTILKILSELDENDFDEDLKKYLSNPTLINNVDVYQRYENQRLASIRKKLLGKYKQERINVDNKRNAVSEYATEEYAEKIIREYQEYLVQNPDVASIKRKYILRTEEKIQRVKVKMMEMIENVRKFEIDRRENEVSNRSIIDKRWQMGYRGLSEGVSLDMEHIMMDAIQDINKEKGQKGRSYEQPERFMRVEDIIEFLKKLPSQRFIELEAYDPLMTKNKGKREIKGDENKINKFINDEYLAENFERIKGFFNNNSDLKEKVGKGQEKKLIKKIEGLENELKKTIDEKESEMKKLNELRSHLNILRKSGGDAKKINQDIEQINKDQKNKGQEYKEKIDYWKEKILRHYKTLIENLLSKKEASKLFDEGLIRIKKIVDQNLVKFIYAVKADESIIVDMEIVRGDISGRAAHSELGEGRNIYGAGELVFELHNKVFNDVRDWKEEKKNYAEEKNSDFKLTEINNGSGHYRPSVEVLQYVENLLKEKGIDVNKAKLTDSLTRGIGIKEMGLFS